MCRHLAHVGDPMRLDDLLFAAPRSLCTQGRDAREMGFGTSNPDGWGVAWWTSPNLPPLHYRTTTPMWDDREFRARGDQSRAILGAVRMASPGSTLRAENNAPFVAPSRVGPLAFSLNGYAFHPSSAARVRAVLPPGTAVDGDTDTEVLFAAVLDRIRRGDDPAGAVAAVHHAVEPGPDVFMNLLLVGANVLVATTWRHTLYVRRTGAGTTVVSEALDAGTDWTRVPDGSLVVATPDSVRIDPLEGHCSP
jgi:gamma-glutamyl hercynylcysteine S-oxide hydrolase